MPDGELKTQSEVVEAKLVDIPADVPATIPTTPMEMVAFALARGDGVEVLGKLMDLQDRQDAKTAKSEYVKAMAAFRAETIHISRDKENKQYDSRYTSKGNLINTASPYLGKHGLSHDFDIVQTPDLITVSCTLTHEDGHSKTVPMSAPPDKTGQKNVIQQIKSTKTYLEIATFESVTGLASREGNLDDDGNGAGAAVEKITEDQSMTISALATEVDAKYEPFLKYLSKKFKCPIKEIDDIPARHYTQVIDLLEVKRNA